MLKAILGRNIVVFIILALIVARVVDWDKCFNQRARYLLGIYYNGHFLNSLDGVVYKDYLKRHGTNQAAFQQTL